MERQHGALLANVKSKKGDLWHSKNAGDARRTGFKKIFVRPTGFQKFLKGKDSNPADWWRRPVVAQRLECGRFTAAFARPDAGWFVKFCATESAAQAGAVQTLREFGGTGEMMKEE